MDETSVMIAGILAAIATGEPIGEAQLARTGPFREAIVDTEAVPWEPKSLAGLAQKMLWRDERTGASIALLRFEAGAGIPSVHTHAANQFMLCLRGRYRYAGSGIVLTPGCFYWNPVGEVHGPTHADEESVLLEIFDGPHYPSVPDWYADANDAR